MTLGHQPTSAFHENKVPRNRLRTPLVVKHLAGCPTHTQFSNNGATLTSVTTAMTATTLEQRQSLITASVSSLTTSLLLNPIC